MCRLFRNQLGYKGENEVCVSDFARRNCPFLLAAPSQQQPECLVPSVRLHGSGALRGLGKEDPGKRKP